MKSHNCKIARTIASTLMSLLFLAAASFAATKPLINPEGLALDSKGNLYVANEGGNQVLIYNPSYQQLTVKTISINLNGPTGVAFDGSGNLWVSNINSSQIYEYSPTGAFLQRLSEVDRLRYSVAEPRPFLCSGGHGAPAYSRRSCEGKGAFKPWPTKARRARLRGCRGRICRRVDPRKKTRRRGSPASGCIIDRACRSQNASRAQRRKQSRCYGKP